MTDVGIDADVLAEIEEGIVRVYLRQVVRVVVKADPDLVLVGNRSGRPQIALFAAKTPLIHRT